MRYNFERFTGKGSRFGGSWISYSKSGFLFSSGFTQREKVLDYVVLFYDKENLAIGFLFTSDENTPGALKVVHGNKGTTASVASRSFVNTHDINKSQFYGRKNPEKVHYEGAGDLFVIKLKNAQDSNGTTPSGSSSV